MVEIGNPLLSEFNLQFGQDAVNLIKILALKLYRYRHLCFCHGVSVASKLVSTVNEIEVVHVRDEGISFLGWVLETIYHANQVGAHRETPVLVQVSSSGFLG